MFEIADPIPNMGSMGHFQVSSTYSPRVLKLMTFWSNLGLVRTLKLGEFKENHVLPCSGENCVSMTTVFSVTLGCFVILNMKSFCLFGMMFVMQYFI